MVDPVGAAGGPVSFRAQSPASRRPLRLGVPLGPRRRRRRRRGSEPDDGRRAPSRFQPQVGVERFCHHAVHASLEPGACLGFFIGEPRPKGRKSRPKAGAGFLGRVSQPSPPTARGLGRCELPQRGLERSPDRPKVFHYFSTQDGLF